MAPAHLGVGTASARAVAAQHRDRRPREGGTPVKDFVPASEIDSRLRGNDDEPAGEYSGSQPMREAGEQLAGR